MAILIRILEHVSLYSRLSLTHDIMYLSHHQDFISCGTFSTCNSGLGTKYQNWYSKLLQIIHTAQNTSRPAANCEAGKTYKDRNQEKVLKITTNLAGSKSRHLQDGAHQVRGSRMTHEIQKEVTSKFLA